MSVSLMFATHCPYCRHANARGARFCAECGAALHLKPCPKCGRVDDVTARQCAECGTLFPAIALGGYDTVEPPAAADAGGDASVAAEERVRAPRVAEPPKPAYRAGPLILVALVAGGLPMIWMNRADLPIPKAWRIGGPNAAGSAVETPPAPAVVVQPAVAPVAAPAAGTPESAGVAANAAPPPSVVETPAARPAVSQADKPEESEAKPAAPPPPVAPEQAKAVVRKKTLPTKVSGHKSPPADSPPRAARPCTEAMVALGLCDQSEQRK